MTKPLSPLGQSMASLFTPESERLAAARKTKESSRAPQQNGMRIPGMPGIQSHKSGDSLGNPNSPGYEAWGKKDQNSSPSQEHSEAKGPAGKVIEAPSQGPEVIRITSGWEKLLLAQKKLCEKAKNLFTSLEGRPKYAALKSGGLLALKSRGCIVDLDLQETAEQIAEDAHRSASEKKPA